ncbi:hypothetical protein SSPIM334S_06869 [Streptomyces spiroverticillatus]|uniref:hypothetical protein n=1 Tax=Streptomyces finlayi TaxID=67296 RepID=UPI001E59AAF9|nr:hypothetical protein [Streptomyces finlayi]
MQDETWTTDEYGKSHEGRVGVLLPDGSVPEPVYFDGSSTVGQMVAHWSVYDGEGFRRPKADSLLAVCSCGWEGEARRLDWEAYGEVPMRKAALGLAEKCLLDWDRHTAQVGESTVALPGELVELLREVEHRIEHLTADTPVVTLKALRHLEVMAVRLGHGAAHNARHEPVEEVAAGLGLNVRAAKALLARFGQWDFYG